MFLLVEEVEIANKAIQRVSSALLLKGPKSAQTSGLRLSSFVAVIDLL